MFRTPNGEGPASSSVVEREYGMSGPWFVQLTFPSSRLSIRHVAQTGAIKNLVITEEGGIAKGIRRIIAVTAEDAQEVTRAADALASKIGYVSRMSGSEKEAGLKALSVVCDCLTPRLLWLTTHYFGRGSHRSSIMPTLASYGRTV